MLILLHLLLQPIIEPKRFFSEQDDLFFQEDGPLVGHHLLLLLLGPFLDICQLLLHLLDMIAIGQQKLSLMSFDNLLDLAIHFFNGTSQLSVYLVSFI